MNSEQIGPYEVFIVPDVRFYTDVSHVFNLGATPEEQREQIGVVEPYLRRRREQRKVLADDEQNLLAWLDLREGRIGDYVSRVVTSDRILAKATSVMRARAEAERRRGAPTPVRETKDLVLGQLHDVAGAVLAPNEGFIHEVGVGGRTSHREDLMDLVTRLDDIAPLNARVVALTVDRKLAGYSNGRVQILNPQRWTSFTPAPVEGTVDSPVRRAGPPPDPGQPSALRNVRNSGTSGIRRVTSSPWR